MEEENLGYLPPDYSEYPREDDDDLDDDDIEDYDDEEEDESEDLRIEKLLDEQSKYNEDLARVESIELKRAEEKEMADTPFGSSQPWKTGSSSNNNNAGEAAPWEKQAQQSTGFGSWGSGGSSWNNVGTSWGNNSTTQKPTVDYTRNEKVKSVLIVDALDCLVESYDSNGKPGILPRSIFDLKPKFDVWERLASFNPRRIYVLFPAIGLVPSIGNTESAKVASEYIAQCIAAYLRIPRNLCSIIHVVDNAVKEQNISGILSMTSFDHDSVLYVGVRSGRYGLSSEDIIAAKKNGIDYMDLYNLLKGRYEYE